MIEKINIAINAIDVLVGGTLAYATYNLSRKLHYKPKVKLNLFRLEHHLRTEYDLIIENVSKYNLYDFKIELKEFDDITYGFNSKDVDKDIKGTIGLLTSDIPVFTIGQKYRTFLMDAYLNKGLEELNFTMEYKVKNKPNAKIHKEHIKLNIKAFISFSMEQD